MGTCPQGHAYGVDYELVPGQHRTYCQACDVRAWDRTFEGTFLPRPCWNCGKPILVIFYQSEDLPVSCDISCFKELVKNERVPGYGAPRTEEGEQ